jgi:diguanylate cyclase (GGDEF)-like protein
MAVTRDILGKVKIFADLEPAELGDLRGMLRPHILKAEQVLFREGDPGGELYVVESGSIGISVNAGDGQSVEIASFRAGDFFGEMSIFERERRSATCRAKSACRLLSLQQDDLFRYMAEQPASAARIMKRMLAVTRRRLEDTGEFLSDMVLWGEQARRRAITDPLTGLYNRRYLEEAQEEYLTKARDSRQPLAIVMLDLDHFREINEEYSQEVGDKVIVAAAEVFRRHLRPADAAARYGGDEFTFLLPGADCTTAGRILEAIRADIEALSLLAELPAARDGTPARGVRRLTTSLGLACYPEHGEDIKSLRSLADAALYRAKELGRNRVMTAAP